MTLNRTLKTILYFILFSVVAFLAQRQIVNFYIDSYVSGNQSDQISLLVTAERVLYYIEVGIITYFLALYLTTISGLVFAKLQKDKMLIRGFTITTILTFVHTILYYVYI